MTINPKSYEGNNGSLLKVVNNNLNKKDMVVLIFQLYNVSTYSFTKKNMNLVSILQIYSVYKEDFGQYTCEAGNKYGKTSQHLELYESSIPICPPLCGDTDLNSAATITSRENWKAAVSLLTGSAISLFMQRLIMV